MLPPKVLFHETAHWVARVMAAVLLLTTAGILYGNGLPNPMQVAPVELLLFFAFFVMLLGAMLGWHFERLGGGLLIGGFLAFYMVNSFAGYRFPVSVVFGLFGIAGVLYLLSWVTGPQTQESTTRSQATGR